LSTKTDFDSIFGASEEVAEAMKPMIPIKTKNASIVNTIKASKEAKKILKKFFMILSLIQLLNL
jgi:hypothetical protein